jgi:hypothetical protein
MWSSEWDGVAISAVGLSSVGASVAMTTVGAETAAKPITTAATTDTRSESLLLDVTRAIVRICSC